MARYEARVSWTLQPGEDFLKGRYSRGHSLAFDGVPDLAGSASAHVVGNRWAVEKAVDPEEMLVASISACHMLTFLHRARLAGFVCEAYLDEAVGLMAAHEAGRLAVTEVTLRPVLRWTGPAPDAETLSRLHHEAHEECFIANSVTSRVTIETP